MKNPCLEIALPEKVVLDQWVGTVYGIGIDMRLVTDGERDWIEYRYTDMMVWFEDDGMPTCSDEAFNMLVPDFNGK